MKYFLLILALFLVSCSDDNSNQVSKLKHDLRFTTDQLETCQSQLSVYRNSGSSSSTTETVEETKPAEPQYEEVEAVEFKVENKTVTCYDRDAEQCGMTFSNCKDGMVYRCMVNVKYKLTTEKKLVE